MWLYSTYAKFEAFTAVIFQAEVYWDVTPCNIAVGYQHFRGPCFFPLQGADVGGMDLWNFGILPQNYTSSQQRRVRIEMLNIICNWGILYEYGKYLTDYKVR